MAGTLSLNFTTQMMENHIPATVLDAPEGFSAAVGADGTQYLVAVSGGMARATFADPTQNGGWNTVDFSEAVPSGSTATHARIAHNSADDTIAVVLVTADAGGVSTVQALAGMNGSDAQSWLGSGATRNWTALAFDSAQVSSISAASLNVQDIELGLDSFNVPSGTASPQAFANVADGDGNVYAFMVAVPQSGSAPSGTVWNNVPLPSQFQDLLGYCAGRPYELLSRRGSENAPGYYILSAATTSSPTNVAYMPFTAAFTISYVLPNGAQATAIAALGYSNSSTNGYWASDLFITDTQGNLYVASGANASAPAANAPVVVASSPLFANASTLHAVVDAGCDTVIVWGTNANGQLFHTEVAFGSRFDNGAWSPAVILLTGVQAMAPAFADATGQIGIFSVTTSGGATASATQTSGAPPAPPASSIVFQNRTPTTGHWNTALMPVPTTTDYVRLSTYTDRIVVADANGIAQPNVQVTATPGIDATVIVNGQNMTLAAFQPVSLTTDSSGAITIVHPLSNLVGMQLQLVAPGQTTAQLLDPHQQVIAAIQKLDPNNLGAATYTNSDGSTQPLFPSGADLSGLQQALPVIQQAVVQLPTALQLSQSGGTTGRRMAARSGAALGFSISNSLGDVAQFICNLGDDIENVVVKIVGDISSGFQLVVNWAEQTFTAVINTVEDAIHAICAFVQMIVKDIELVFRWLAYIFDWSDIMAVQQTILGGITALAGSFETALEDLQTLVDARFASILDLLQSDAISGLPAKAGSNTPQAFSGANQNVSLPGGFDPRSDARVGWVSQRWNDIQNGAGSVSYTPAQNFTPGPKTTTALNALNSAWQIISATGSGMASAVSDMASGDSTGQAFTQAFLTAPSGQQSPAVIIVSAIQGIIDDLFGAAEEMVEGFVSLLTTQINVPVISSLYQDLASEPLTAGNLLCIFPAVLFTLPYKICQIAQNPDGPWTDASTIMNGTNFSASMTNAFNALLPSTGVAAARPLGDSEPAVGWLWWESALALGTTGMSLTDYVAAMIKQPEMCVVGGLFNAFIDFLSGLTNCVLYAEGTPEAEVCAPPKMGTGAIGAIWGISMIGAGRDVEYQELMFYLLLGATTMYGLIDGYNIVEGPMAGDATNWGDAIGNFSLLFIALTAKTEAGPIVAVIGAGAYVVAAVTEIYNAVAAS